MFGRRLRYRGARGRLGRGGGGAFGFDSGDTCIGMGLALSPPCGSPQPTEHCGLCRLSGPRALKETPPLAWPLVARTSTLSRREGEIAQVILFMPISTLIPVVHGRMLC